MRPVAAILLVALACSVSGSHAAHLSNCALTGTCSGGSGGTAIVSPSADTGVIVFADADGNATYDDAVRVVGGIVYANGIVIAAELLDWINGLGSATNEVSGGTHKSCATAKFPGGGASNGGGVNTWGRGDLGAGAGPVYMEDCDNGVPSTTHKRQQFSATSWSPGTTASCIGIGTIGVYDPTANLTHKNALLINPARPLRIRAVTVAIFGRQTTSAAPFGFATDASGNFTATEKMYVDLWAAYASGEFTQITNDGSGLGLAGATRITRVAFEKNDAVGVTDATDEIGGAIFDFDANYVMWRELNIPVPVSGGDPATLFLCAESDDPDWTGDGTANGGTAASADWSIELEYDN